MGKRSAAVDAYIAKAAPFAQPILEKIRVAFHATLPDVVETIRWGVPHFDHNGVIANMAAFKQHVTFGFWKSKLMNDPHKLFTAMGEKTAMGGMKLRQLADLPSRKILTEYIREAARLNEEGVKIERAPRTAAAPVKVPDDLETALAKNRKAREAFEDFSPSHRREYIQWITEAKREETRKKRVEQALAWMAEGKSRNWKYEK